jgi:hypothetical protein
MAGGPAFDPVAIFWAATGTRLHDRAFGEGRAEGEFMHKITLAGAIGAIIGLVAIVGTAGAAPPRKGGGGGAPHPAPAAHAAAPHFSAPRAAPHFAARPANRVATTPHATPNLAVRRGTAQGPAAHLNAPNALHARGPGFNAANATRTNARSTFARNVGRTDPHNFAARRQQFAGDPAFRPFFGRGWHRNHHLGWVGPLFWPFAFGDFFYGALWPSDYGYDDPFWAYGYDDIYTGIFFPYDYEPYVQGPQAPARMTSLTQGVKDACESEAAEVTNWPIDQIQEIIQPNDQQKALLDELGNAIVQASTDVASHCPSNVAFTPVDRLGQMQVRLQGLIDATNIVSPPLAKFYDSLDDEQKARFNDMKPTEGATASNNPPTPEAAKPANPQDACGSGTVMAWPTEQIDQALQPTEAQKQKLDALQSAAAQAAGTIKAACPGEPPATPPGRLAAIGKRLEAQLNAVQTVEGPLKDFYDSLDNDQKARFNNIGQQIFAEK